MKETYHLGLTAEALKGARLAIVPGDPGRVPRIAGLLDQPEALAGHREYLSCFGRLAGRPLVVVSTGIGGPSASICVDELAQLGVRTFLRVGTSGAIQDAVKPGDVVITSASVRLDGASCDFAPIAYPAASDFRVTSALVAEAEAQGLRFHVGVTASTDTFYPGQERYGGFSSAILPRLRGSLEQWRQLGVLNFDMESATLLTMCGVMGLRAGCVTGVVVNRILTEEVLSEDLERPR